MPTGESATSVLEGDCIEVMRSMPDASVDAIVTDPPYGLRFMGKEFDCLGDGPAQQEWHRVWAVEALRVLKPGGHLLAFGGSRTYHRLASAVEDGGFEIRDQIMWLHSQGFPKSLDVSKAIDKAAGAERQVVGSRRGTTAHPDTGRVDMPGKAVGVKQAAVDVPITAPATDAAKQWAGWGTALKPAHEPIVVARKPLIGTVAANVRAFGTGALNVDGCRIHTGDNLNGGAYSKERKPSDSEWVKNGGTIHSSTGQTFVQPAGRWPANVMLDPVAAAMLDDQSGVSTSGAAGRKGSSGFANGYDGDYEVPYGDTGGASRFFYCAKASSRERNAGLDDARNAHPTVKPIDLMRYLCRLVTPPNGTVLDPFAGSGTTGCAAVLEGFSFIGIEREPEYVEIARARIAHWTLTQLTLDAA